MGFLLLIFLMNSFDYEIDQYSSWVSKLEELRNNFSDLVVGRDSNQDINSLKIQIHVTIEYLWVL